MLDRAELFSVVRRPGGSVSKAELSRASVVSARSFEKIIVGSPAVVNGQPFATIDVSVSAALSKRASGKRSTSLPSIFKVRKLVKFMKTSLGSAPMSLTRRLRSDKDVVVAKSPGGMLSSPFQLMSRSCRLRRAEKRSAGSPAVVSPISLIDNLRSATLLANNPACRELRLVNDNHNSSKLTSLLNIVGGRPAGVSGLFSRSSCQRFVFVSKIPSGNDDIFALKLSHIWPTLTSGAKMSAGSDASSGQFWITSPTIEAQSRNKPAGSVSIGL